MPPTAIAATFASPSYDVFVPAGTHHSGARLDRAEQAGANPGARGDGVSVWHGQRGQASAQPRVCEWR